MRHLQTNLSYANVVATFALFIALGGVSYAAVTLPANSVGRAQLKPKSVTLSKVAPSTRAALRGQTGAQGPAGSAGAIGPSGADGLVGPKGPTGVTGEKGEKGDPGGTDGYFDRDSTTIVASQSNTDVATTSLDDGKYLITVSMNVTGQNGAPVNCALFDPQDQQLDSSSIKVAPAYLGSGNSLVLSASTTLSADGDITVGCSFPDPNNANNGNQYTFSTGVSAVQLSALHNVD